MPTKLRSKLVGALVAAAALLALPAAAQATLVYTKGALSPVVYSANDNGSGAKKVAKGSNPSVLPDGSALVYLHEGPGHAQEMKLAPVGGGAGKTIMQAWRDPFNLAISGDSTLIAAARGPELGKRKLVVIDLDDGSEKLVATGYFNGYSFSPKGNELVYGMASSESYPPKTDVYRYSYDTGAVTKLTKDKVSQSPLWSPDGSIVFVKLLEANKRQYGPKNELYSMNSNGTGVKRLTHTKVDPLLQGLFPTEFSANGKKLLTEFQGQDTSYAVAVNPKTGAQKPIVKAEEQGFVGTAISSDGATVLGFDGGFEGGNKQNVVIYPYGGGKKKVLVKGAYDPDWNL
jgi:dipeptidyl aminopeptidase/acylaminoacyl peptidase